MVAYGISDIDGFLKLSGGGPLSLTTIENALGDNLPGITLRPQDIWTVGGGLVFNGLPNFRIKSNHQGSIGWNGQPVWSGGYIKCDSSGDGIQVFASTPAGSPTQGIVFERCNLIGTNPGANAIHFGGGERACGLKDCFVYNLSSAVNSYGFTNDTALSNNNGEDMIFDWSGGGGVASGWVPVGWGINDQANGHCNDTCLYNLRTSSGGPYAFQKNNGGGVTLLHPYDRSNPATATYYNHGGARFTLIGGEDQNTTGQSHLIDAASAETCLINRAVTQAGAQTTTCAVSAGKLIVRGLMTFNNAQTIALSGTGKVALDDPGINGANASLTGAAGMVAYLLNAAKYYTGAAPVVTGFTGTVNTQY